MRLVALLAALAMLAAACGSDDDDSADASDSDTDTTEADNSSDDSGSDDSDDSGGSDDSGDDGGGEASGEPIKVMAMGPIESPVFSIPTIPTGAQVAVDEINAAGGVNGRPLELIVCNDEFNPQMSTECVQDALSNDVVAFVGGLIGTPTALFPLTADHAWIGPAAAGVSDASNYFPLGGDGSTAFGSVGMSAALDGCANVAVIDSVAAGPENSQAMVSGVEAGGGTVVSTLAANESGDFAPIIETALADGAECIASGVSPGEIGGLLTGNAGRLPIYTIDGPLPPALLAALGEAADGVHIASAFPPPGSGNPKTDELQAIATEIGGPISLDQFFFAGYGAVMLVAEVAAGLDEVTAANVQAGIRELDAYDTGLGPVIDFTKGSAVEGFSAIYNPRMYLMEASGGAYVLLQDDPIDITPAFELIAAAG
jgi:ABC-type branched-subunit amino acid transport system substrate-binding protein